jgi:hypothetical protein
MSTTINGIGIAGAAVLILGYLLIFRADPYRGYGGVGRAGIVFAALAGSALPIFTSFAGTSWSLFGALASVAQTLGNAAQLAGGAP